MQLSRNKVKGQIISFAKYPLYALALHYIIFIRYSFFT